MEWSYYLRLMVNADKAACITAVTVTDIPTRYTPADLGGHTRKAIAVYNNSNAASGECFYGYSDNISAYRASMPIPKGAMVEIPIASGESIPLYFVSGSGEIGDLRVEELA